MKKNNNPIMFSLVDEQSGLSVNRVLHTYIELFDTALSCPYMDINHPAITLTKVKKSCGSTKNILSAVHDDIMLSKSEWSQKDHIAQIWKFKNLPEAVEHFHNHLDNFYNHYGTFGRVADYLQSTLGLWNDGWTTTDIVENLIKRFKIKAGCYTTDFILADIAKEIDDEDWVTGTANEYLKKFIKNDYYIVIREKLTNEQTMYLQSLFLKEVQKSDLYKTYEETRAKLNKLSPYSIKGAPYIKITNKTWTTFKLSGRQFNDYALMCKEDRYTAFEKMGIVNNWDVHSSIPALISYMNTGYYDPDMDIKEELLKDSGVTSISRTDLKKDGLIYRFAFDNGNYGRYTVGGKRETNISKNDWDKLQNSWNKLVGKNPFKNSSLVFLYESIAEMNTMIDLYEQEGCGFVGNAYDCFYVPVYVNKDNIKYHYYNNVNRLSVYSI